MIAKLMRKWQTRDGVIKYVLINLTLDELKRLDVSNYMLDNFNQWKSSSDLLARRCAETREQKSQGGGPLDVVSTFRFRFKLDAAQDKRLRLLNHKDLRYVLNNFDGVTPLEEVIAQAADFEPEDESAENALPESDGVSTVGRFKLWDGMG